MKTTFKKVFNELNDEFISIENFNVDENIDIDIENIKREVLMCIDDKNGKKKFSKKLITLLVAAAILITGTVGAFATGSVQSIFKELFNNSGMNSAGFYDGGNVEIVSCDDSLNVELLGVTGDGEKPYSAIKATKKDGSEVIDKDYKYPFWFVNDMPEQLPEDKTVDNRQKTLEGTAIDVIVKYADGSTQTKIINVDFYQSFENDKYGSSQIIFSYKD